MRRNGPARGWRRARQACTFVVLVLATACGDGGAGGRAGEAGEQATPPSVDTAPDTEVEVEIHRDGETRTLRVTIGKRAADLR